MERCQQKPVQSAARVASSQHAGFSPLIFLLLFSWLLVLPVIAAASAQYIDVSLGFDTGKFSSSQRADTFQLGATYGVFYDDYDISIFLPYLKLSDPIGDESGVGDLILRGGRKVFEDKAGNYLYASAALKIPTADETKGLGTGEKDVGVFINYARSINQIRMVVSTGYIATGDSNTVNYNDTFNYGISLSKILENKFIYMGLEGRQQAQPTGDDPLDLTAGMYYQLQSQQFVHVEGLLGLSDGSPDYGIIIGFTRWFD